MNAEDGQGCRGPASWAGMARYHRSQPSGAGRAGGGVSSRSSGKGRARSADA